MGSEPITESLRLDEGPFQIRQRHGHGQHGWGFHGVTRDTVETDPRRFSLPDQSVNFFHLLTDQGVPLLVARHDRRLDGTGDSAENGLKLADDVLERPDPVIEPLVDRRFDGLVVEVVADPDTGVHLADAVDTTDALLNAHRVPRHVVVDQHAARLEVQTLRSGFRAEENLDLRVLPEGRLDVLLAGARPRFAIPLLAALAAVAGHLSTVDLTEPVTHVVHRVGVLREDDHRVPPL